MIEYTKLYPMMRKIEHPQPLGIAGDSRYIEDLVRSDDALRQLIKDKDIKGVETYNSLDLFTGTRYIIPMRKGEILVCYEHPEPFPERVLYNDDEIHYFSCNYYRNGKEVPLYHNDEYKLIW